MPFRVPGYSDETTPPPENWKQKYENLLVEDRLGPFVKWQGLYENADGSKTAAINSYKDWPQNIKDQLFDYLYIYETGGNPAGENPPSPAGDMFGGTITAATSYINAEDALKIYLVHVAHSLWVEANNLVSWPIVKYKDPTKYIFKFPYDGTYKHVLQWLLDSTLMFMFDANLNQYWFSEKLMGSITDWNPKYSYEFLQSSNILSLGPTGGPRITVVKLTEWMRKNLDHISGGGTYEKITNQLDWLEALYGYRGMPPVEKIINPPYSDLHITVGCWGTTGLYSALLRSINIPVINYNEDAPVSQLCSSKGGHSRPIFPTLNISLSHGDDPYDVEVKWAEIEGFNSPVLELAKVIYPDKKAESDLLNPILDCDEQGNCNSAQQQVCYNFSKNLVFWGVNHENLYLLRMVCNSTEADNKINNFLATRNEKTNAPTAYIKPLFDEDERIAWIEYLKEIIASDYANGDYQAGCETVKQKYYDLSVCPDGYEYKYKGKESQCYSCKYAEIIKSSFTPVKTKKDCPGFNL